MPAATPKILEIIVAGIAVNKVPRIKGTKENRGSSEVGYHSKTFLISIFIKQSVMIDKIS